MNTLGERPTILRSYLGRMRGLGIGHNVFNHWWTERLCAAGCAPLSIWFIIQIIRLSDADHKEIVKWAGKPVNNVALLLLVLLTFRHMQLGLEVITTDYVRGVKRLALNYCIEAISVFLASLSIISILKLFSVSSSKDDNTK